MSSIHIDSDEQFQQTLSAIKNQDPYQTIVLDFTASWCGPCQRISPEVDKLALKYSPNLSVFKIDVDKARQTAREYNIECMPTFIVTNGAGTYMDVVKGANLPELLSKAAARIHQR